MQGIVYPISRFIFSVLLKIVCKLEVTGRENFPRTGPFIVASNHISLADPPVVGVSCSRVRLIFMAKRELFELPSWGWWFRAMACIPVQRGAGDFMSLRRAVHELRKKKAIVIFPEGGRSPDGNLQKAEDGIGFIAAKSEAPIIPVYITGTDKVLPKGAKFFRAYKVKAKVGSAITIDRKALLSRRREAYKFIGRQVMNAILRLRDEFKR